MPLPYIIPLPPFWIIHCEIQSRIKIQTPQKALRNNANTESAELWLETKVGNKGQGI